MAYKTQSKEFYQQIGRAGIEKQSQNRAKAEDDAFNKAGPYVRGDPKGCGCDRCKKARDKGVRA